MDIKQILKKIMSIFFIGISIIFIGISISLIILFISMFFDNTVPTDFTKPLKNNYYIKGTKDGTRLYNKSNDYKYPDNFPKENIIEKIEKEDILLLRCENDIIYIINMSSDEIVGPLSEKKFLEKSVDYINADFFDWDVIVK